MENQKLIDEFEAAAILGISVKSLRTWRSTGKVVIPFCKIGKSVRYSPAILQEYITLHTQGGEL